MRLFHLNSELKILGINWFNSLIIDEMSLRLTVENHKNQWKFIYKFPFSTVQQELFENKTAYQSKVTLSFLKKLSL
jgi:hypothetical protein